MFLTEGDLNGEVSFFRGKKGVEYEISTISGQRTAHFFLQEKVRLQDLDHHFRLSTNLQNLD